MHPGSRLIRLVLIGAFLLEATACGASGAASTEPPTTSARPSSTARLAVLSPRAGSVVHGTTVDVRLSLRDARIVRTTSTDLQPDEGHVHLYLDGKLISMNYQLTNQIPDVSPGHHVIQVEFVANDHAPFDPRVIAVTSFEVRP